MPVQSQFVDVTSANFQQDVVDASHEVPVVLDFWASWCGPCRQFGPLLEKVTAGFEGRIRLAKVDADAAPDLTGAFGVSSIPFVAAVRNGQIVDQFTGVLPETELRAWFERLLPSPVEELLAQAKELEASDPVAAEQIYREAAALAPEDDRLKIALARVLVALGRDDESLRLIEQLEARGFLEPEAEQVRSQLELRAVAAEAGSVDQARRDLEANPDDPALKIRLADALAVDGKPQEALDLLLDVVRADRSGKRNEARESMVRIFDLLGPGHPLVPEYRRKLATALY